MYLVVAIWKTEKILVERKETTLLAAWSVSKDNENSVKLSMCIATKPDPTKVHSKKANQLRPQQTDRATLFFATLVCIHCHLSFTYRLDLDHYLPPTKAYPRMPAWASFGVCQQLHESLSGQKSRLMQTKAYRQESHQKI